ncbi:SAM-dependent methyltransferase [Ramlibacter sp.]|uniref:SAM-dependent methyltransferase n=1 Tax=Ramlibacter sp. TaxID=1917967 RepID=UPI002FC735AF
MDGNRSIAFFDAQFRRQVAAGDYALNPFEAAALPHLRGTVLDYGCGLGNLAVQAARRGCDVLALDASETAIDHLRELASREGLRLRAEAADLRTFQLTGDFDAVACIGLLMFFDCPTALAQLAQLQAHVRPGGVAIVNVLVEGTTFMEMFSPEGHCLLDSAQLQARFAGWEMIGFAQQAFPAAGDTVKLFATLIARKPPDPVAPSAAPRT